ncbi:MAG TPA: hypothetical protein VJ463_05190 [Geothrix sp.]|nr:hypothetical protein [Geothrix sp.]
MYKPVWMTGVLAALMGAVPGSAQGTDQDMFKFSGFGTFAAVHSSEKNADFTTNFSQPKGPGFTRSTDLGLDSRLGLQVDLRFTEGFSAVVQAISERRYDNSYDPYLNMAHLKFQALPGLAFRAGRIPYSAYLISDYQKVGYATPWARPPVEVYQFNPITSVDGVDLTWQATAGPVAFSGQVLGGSTTARVPSAAGDAKFKGDSLGSASLAAAYGSATFRVFYLQMKGSFDSSAVDGPAGPYALLRTLPPAFGGNPALADQYQIKKDRITYLSLGYNYDPGDWFVMAEAARTGGDENQLLHTTAGYVTGGYRFGAWTPYLTAGWKKTDSPTSHANPIVNAIISGQDHAQNSVSVGLRWDFHKNLAAKAQFDRVKNAAGSYGALVNIHPGFKTGETYNLATLALDFVF